MSSEGGTKAIIAAMSANMGIAVTKFVAFALTGSSSMLAEGVHSVADSGNQVLLLVGGRMARRPADASHPFGYGRDRYLFAFIVSIVLFTLGGLFALYEAWEKWQDPHPLDPRWWWVPLVVLVVSMVMEGLSLRTAVREVGSQRAGRSWWRFIRSSKSPELPVVLLEDTAALVGLLLALLGVGLTVVTHDGRWDAAGTAGIGLLLVVVAVVLAVETSSLLVGEGASQSQVDLIEAALVGGAVRSVIHLRTLHLGPDELLVAAKIEIPQGDAAVIARAIDEAEVRVRAVVPAATVMYLEPDLRREVPEPAAGGDDD
jgi:cation diffusion facilitator family transporter